MDSSGFLWKDNGSTNKHFHTNTSIFQVVYFYFKGALSKDQWCDVVIINLKVE